MTEEEAYVAVVGCGVPEPYWAIQAMPRDVSYGRRDGEFFVGEFTGPSLGIALAKYLQENQRVSDFRVHILPHNSNCSGYRDENCECRCWAIYFRGTLITRHYDRESAERLQEILDRNREVL